MNSLDLNRMNRCWFAIQVKSRHEFMVARLLRGKGYEEFVPAVRSRRKWSDRTKEIDEPLFRGYVFCRFDAEMRRPVVCTHGVLGIVGNSRGPAPIPDSEIEAILKTMAFGLTPEPCEYLNIGDRVRIAGGPLAGVEGVLVNTRNRRQLVLSINLLRNSVVVDVDQCMTTGPASLMFFRTGGGGPTVPQLEIAVA